MWISAAKWRLVEERVSARRDTTIKQAHIQRLDRAINAIPKEDRRSQTEETGEEVEQLLGADPPSTGKHGT